MGVAASSSIPALDYSGSITAEERLFWHEGAEPEQDYRTDLSAALRLHFSQRWDDGRQALIVSPFMRVDQRDDERTHNDLRECLWELSRPGWDLRLGLRKVFWGVTESEHLVDVINQTDLVEDPAGEEKLGQPMANVSVAGSLGALDVFAMPYFRERTFPGRYGRLRTSPPVDTDNATYESDAEQRHVDVAARWSHTLAQWDIGLSGFRGTNREPDLRFALDDSYRPVLRPHYALISQWGVDAQVTWDNLLGKFEAIHRIGQGDPFTACDGGFEYTVVGAFGSIDLGVLGEYLYDSRGAEATMPFEDDLYVGIRIVGNDEHSTQLLLGSTMDRKSHAQVIRMTGSRRIGSSLRINLTGWSYLHIPDQDLLSGFADDDVLQLGIECFF